MRSGKMVMMITPLAREYKKGKRVNKNWGFWKRKRGREIEQKRNPTREKERETTGIIGRKFSLDCLGEV